MIPDLTHLTLTDVAAQMRGGHFTPTQLLEDTLARIAAHPDLNAVIVMNPHARDAARESDARFNAGDPRPLEGIPFTVKDSYLALGLTAASGSPAFANLIAHSNAFTLETLLAAGAVLIGKTNMPPMADGGMQRGLYGRSESPFNPNYLPAAYASGSSHGSAVAVAQGLGLFGMGEETVSSGRSPASNNGICAYTPSRGVLSLRGNWPLFPTRDVIVPHTRSIADLCTLLDTLVVTDPITRGDFWREQSAVPLPTPESIRPDSYQALSSTRSLDGVRLAVPRRFLGTDPEFPLTVHPDISTLTNHSLTLLRSAGAELIETDFPLLDQYEGHSSGHEQLDQLGGLPEDWMHHEFTTLVAIAWDDFLRANDDPALHRLTQVDPRAIFPLPAQQLPDRYPEVADNLNRYDDILAIAHRAETHGVPLRYADVPGITQALRRLESLRETLLEAWLDEIGCDAVVFPANCDVARANADHDREAADHAWRNGVFYSNGNLALRHLGVPSVTTSMGIMPSTGMPVGITFAGKASDDSRLISIAAAFEHARGRRPIPPQ